MDFNMYIPEKLEGLSPMIWEQISSGPQNWKLLPDGHLDLIFRFEEPWVIHSEVYTSRSYNPTAQFCFLSGLQSKPIKVSFKKTHEIGVRLNAVAVKLIFGIPCSELVDWAVDGRDVLGVKMDEIENTLQELPDFYTRARWLEHFICSIIGHHADMGLAMKISGILDKVSTQRINGEPFDICSLTGYSRMHTYRIFKEWFGLSPSQAVSMRQFISALGQMHSDHQSLTQLALTNGYYDQPHFVRAFKQYAGMTPREYLNYRTDIVGQLPF